MILQMSLDNRRSRFAKWLDRYIGIPLVMGLAIYRPVTRLFRRKPTTLPQRILISKLSALGDAVLMLPAIFLLKRNFPQAQIVFLGGGSVEEFAKLIPAVSRFEKFSIKAAAGLARERFDLHIDFDQWIRATAVMAAASRWCRTWGFRSPGQKRHMAYDRTVVLNLNQHMAENFWNLAQGAAAQAGAAAVATSFAQDKEAVRSQWAKDLLAATAEVTEPSQTASSYIVVHPGCGEHGKFREWPLEAWGKLIQSEKSRDPALKIYVTGHGGYEESLGRRLEEWGATSVVGKMSLAQLFPFLKEARRVYSCNTGIMHLAGFFVDSLVVINGPTDSALWGPLWGGKTVKSPLECAPCLTWGYDYGCSDPVCLKAIRVEWVIKRVHA